MNLKMRSLLSNEFCLEIVGQWTQMLKAIFPFCHPKCLGQWTIFFRKTGEVPIFF